MFTRATISTVIVIAACLPAAAAHADEEPLPVFVLGGQSNMAGGGHSKNLPAELRQPNENVLIFDGKEWKPLAPGGRFGPEVTFGAAMAKALGRKIGIIKFAVSGSHLVWDWNPAGKAKNNVYAKALAFVTKARKSRPIEIRGMLWMQGERDSLYPGAAKKYAANLDLLVKSVRKDYQSPNMTFVLGRVNPKPARYKFVKVVRKAQQELKLPRTAWVDCDKLAKHGDGVHYNAAGQRALGKLFADATLKLLKTPAAKQD